MAFAFTSGDAGCTGDGGPGRLDGGWVGDDGCEPGGWGGGADVCAL